MLRKRACDTCHRKKIQCDGAIPVCSHCRHQSLDCTHNRKYGRQSNKKEKKMAIRSEASSDDLLQRIEQIERALQAAQKKMAANKDGTGSPSLSGQAASLSIHNNNGEGSGSLPLNPDLSLAATPDSWSPAFPDSLRSLGLGKLHFAGHLLGGINSYNGIPFFSREGQQWIMACTGERPQFDNLNAAHHPTEPAHMPSRQRAGSATNNGGETLAAHLPPKRIVTQLVVSFSEAEIYHVFPVIDVVLFHDTVDTAYETPSGSATASSILSAQGCVFAFIAMASVWIKEFDGSPPIDGAFFEAHARRLVPEALYETNVENLQILLLLYMYYALHGRTDQVLLFHSLVCRMTLILGGNYHPKTTVPLDSASDEHMDRGLRTKIHLRRIFWLLYSLDKEFCLRTGQPPAMDDDYCDLYVPDVDISPGDSSSSSSSSVNDVNFLIERAKALGLPIVADPILVRLKSRICRSLYSFSSQSKSDTDLLIVVRELDDELERWRETLAPAFRPLMKVVPGAVAPHRDMTHTMHRYMIQFEYLHLLSAIHRASNRCSTWSTAAKSEIQGISSSIDISVRASRSTMILLKESQNNLSAEAFWMFVFYPMTAMLNLFCNILLDPLDPMVESDLQQISEVPALLRSFRVPLERDNDTSYFDLIQDFVAELIRLSHCAANKARDKEGEYSPATS